MASSIKFSPPTWDSDKDKDRWRDFCHQFESFVDYQQNCGEVLLTLACKILGKTRRFVANAAVEDDALSFVAPAPQEADNESGAEEADPPETRQVHTVRDLTPEERLLDRKLHNILDNCIVGSKRDCIETRERSWIQAWVALNKDMGATNIKRKTELMHDLIKMEYKHPPLKSKQYSMELIRKVYETKITMEELMMFCVIQSFPEEYLALKIMLSQKLEEAHGRPEDVYDFVTFAYSTIEMSTISHDAKKALKADIGEVCARCGRNNHATKD